MKRILSLLFVTSSIFSMQLDTIKDAKKSNKLYLTSASVFAPEKLGALSLYHTKKGFKVLKDDEKHSVKKYFTDPTVRDITKKQLKSFLKGGYLSINQMNDGEYSLQAKGRINGGGPILGTVAYWVTKSACYAVGFAALGTVTAATGGAVIGAAGAVGTIGLGAAAVTTTTTAVVATTAGAVVGTAGAGAIIGGTATVVAGTLGTTAVANCALATGAAVAATGSVGATIAGVEAVSLAVGSFFGMLPTP